MSVGGVGGTGGVNPYGSGDPSNRILADILDQFKNIASSIKSGDCTERTLSPFVQKVVVDWKEYQYSVGFGNGPYKQEQLVKNIIGCCRSGLDGNIIDPEGKETTVSLFCFKHDRDHPTWDLPVADNAFWPDKRLPGDNRAYVTINGNETIIGTNRFNYIYNVG